VDRKVYMKYLMDCALEECNQIKQQPTELRDDELEDAVEFIVYYWEVAVHILTHQERWLPEMSPQTKHKRVPEDVADNSQGLSLCQSGSKGMDCASRAYVRIWLNDWNFHVDYCNHHFTKLADAQKHNFIVLIDKRDKEVLFVR